MLTAEYQIWNIKYWNMFLILTVPQIAFQKDIRQQRTLKKPFSSEQGDST